MVIIFAESGKRTSIIFEGYGEYKRFWRRKTVCFSRVFFQENQEQFIRFNADSLQNDLYGISRPSIGTYTILNADNFEQENRLISFYGRANISFKEKYV